MTESRYEEARAVAHLPNLEIEIYRRRPWEGNEELLSITLRAVPSFDVFFRAFEAANPMLFWMRAFETAWTPWLRLGKPEEPPRLGQQARPSDEAQGSGAPDRSPEGDSGEEGSAGLIPAP